MGDGDAWTSLGGPPVKYLSLRLITLYQAALSPLLGSSCRFSPTCSQYTYEAIDRHGWLKGAWMGIRRISRCHPFSKGGYDPV